MARIIGKEADVKILYYHYDELEEISCIIPTDDPAKARAKIMEYFREFRYTTAPLLFKSLTVTDLDKTWVAKRKEGKEWKIIDRYNARYSIVVQQSCRGARSHEQVAMENERFHMAQQLSNNPNDMNEVYANLDFLEGKSV